jgi:alanine racemase
LRNTKAVVSLGAIRYNVRELQKLAGDAGLMAVVKADGYGHGAVQTAKAALSAGVSFLCVATMEEGVILREAGIIAPILVMGALNESDCAQCVSYDLSACIFLPEQIAAMGRAAKEHRKLGLAHLKIDTGFHRLGVSGRALDEVLLSFAQNEDVLMQGIFTHFATADMSDDSFVDKQMLDFSNALKIVRSLGYQPLVHVSNSAATIKRGSLAGDMVRVGISMYGCSPSDEMSLPFTPRHAMRWVSEISALSRLGPMETVGYGRNFQVKRESLIATIPVGYADGYARIWGGKSSVLIHGKRCPVVGRVCMDQLMTDVTGIDNVALHDEVVLLGNQGSQTVSAEELARLMDSIDYEVLVRISQRVPREYIDD